VVQKHGSPYIYEQPNRISVTPSPWGLDDDDYFTTEYSQENFDDEDDISSSVIATLVGR
jgi:hypothetical protein